MILEATELEVEDRGSGRPRAMDEAREGGLGRLHSVENASDRAHSTRSVMFQGAGVRGRGGASDATAANPNHHQCSMKDQGERGTGERTYRQSNRSLPRAR